MGEIAELFTLEEGETFHEVTTFDMYYSGWECDSEGYLVTFLKNGYIDKTQTAIVLSSHGSLYVADKEEMVKYYSGLENGLMNIKMAMYSANMVSEDTDKD